jgi:hypothetical protein
VSIDAQSLAALTLLTSRNLRKDLQKGGNMLRKYQPGSSFIAAVAAITLAMPVCAHAGASKVTTSIKTAVTGSFFFDSGDSSSSEWIDFSGDAQLVVQVIPPDPITPPNPIRVHANMAGVSGIGRTSGMHFVLNGSENFEADGDLPNTLSLQGDYRLIPPNPVVPPSPIIPPTPVVPINFALQLDENGIATSALAVVGQCTSADICGD